MHCRIFPYQTGDGPSNMALDEALLDAASEDAGFAALRTYGWTTPTLSLGYFQEIATAESDPRWRGVPIVRRPTGGGAIWHHHEVTYALVLPASHPLGQRRVVLYHEVHETIAAVLRSLGVAAKTRGRTTPSSNERRPFLCFADQDPEDIIAQGTKIVGSAQRRRSNAILQHGSMLLKRSPRSPELSGAVDQTDLSAEPQFWSQLLVDKLPGALGLVGAAGVLPEAIQERRDALVQSVYRTNSWNRKR